MFLKEKGSNSALILPLALTLVAYENVKSQHTDWEVRAYQENRFLADEDEPTITIKDLGGGAPIQDEIDGTGGKLNASTS